MALPGPAKGLAVATVTYINYPENGFPFRGRCDGGARPSRARPAPRAAPTPPRPSGRSRRGRRPVEDQMDPDGGSGRSPPAEK